MSAVTTTDVLIVGGGIGGLTAAIKAKEQDPSLEVLIVEKQTVGWAGKATKIGGILAFLAPGNDAGTFIDFQVRTAGAYLNDQDLLAKYVHATYGAIEELAEWGATVPRTPTGDLVTIPAFWAPDYSLTFIDIDLMLPLRKRARKLGVRMLSKIHVVDLLKQQDRVVGATGFDIVDGSFHEFRAKATILANGSCGYKVRRFWVAGTGDGIAAAYRAGAEMRNAEYGNLYGHTVYQDTDSGLVPYVHLVNAQGENLAKKYLDDSGPAGVFLPLELIVGMEKEVVEGRGPIYFAPPPGPGFEFETGMPKLTEWMQRMVDKETKYGLPRRHASRDRRAPPWRDLLRQGRPRDAHQRGGTLGHRRHQLRRFGGRRRGRVTPGHHARFGHHVRGHQRGMGGALGGRIRRRGQRSGGPPCRGGGAQGSCLRTAAKERRPAAGGAHLRDPGRDGADQVQHPPER